MTQVNIHEAKTHLSRLFEMVLKGEEVIMTRPQLNDRRRYGRHRTMSFAHQLPAQISFCVDACKWSENISPAMNNSTIDTDLLRSDIYPEIFPSLQFPLNYRWVSKIQLPITEYF